MKKNNIVKQEECCKPNQGCNRIKDDPLLEELYSDENLSTGKFLMMLEKGDYTKSVRGKEKETTTYFDNKIIVEREYWEETHEKIEKERIYHLITSLKENQKVFDILRAGNWKK